MVNQDERLRMVSRLRTRHGRTDKRMRVDQDILILSGDYLRLFGVCRYVLTCGHRSACVHCCKTRTACVVNIRRVKYGMILTAYRTFGLFSSRIGNRTERSRSECSSSAVVLSPGRLSELNVRTLREHRGWWQYTESSGWV